MMKTLFLITAIVLVGVPTDAAVHLGDVMNDGRYNMAQVLWSEVITGMKVRLQSDTNFLEESRKVLAASRADIYTLWFKATNGMTEGQVKFNHNFAHFYSLGLRAMGVPEKAVQHIMNLILGEIWEDIDKDGNFKLNKDEFELLVTSTALIGTDIIFMSMDEDDDGLLEPKMFRKFMIGMAENEEWIGINEENIEQLESFRARNVREERLNKLKRVDISMFLLKTWIGAVEPAAFTAIFH